MFCSKCGQKSPKGSEFCYHCGDKFADEKAAKAADEKRKNQKKFKAFDIILIIMTIALPAIIAALFILFFAFVIDEPDPDTNQNQNENVNEVVNSNLNLNLNLNTTKSIEEISASVVNIFCPLDTEPFDYYSQGYSGSGTILDTEGLVITNSHVIPQDDLYLNTHPEGCFVTLPDPISGALDEIYLAEPFVYPGISEEYDIAFFDIYDVYVDPYDGYVYGEYPNVFPAFDDTDVCTDENVKLGEKVHIFGYPTSTGGFSLTLTEGIVSSFPGDGTIMTSAKIDSGNSGGLAVDENGCMLGIPSAVYLGNYENMGIIISVDLIYEFMNQLENYY